jgi:hypothetical protein
MIKYAVEGTPVNILVPVNVGTVVFSIVISIIDVQPLKAFAPIVVIPEGIIKVVKLVHP